MIESSLSLPQVKTRRPQTRGFRRNDRVRMDRSLRDGKRELEQATACMQKLDSIIQRLYEDNIDGKISDDRFAKMTDSYEQEQTELKARIAELHDLLAEAKAKSDGIESFLKMVRGRTEITELTPTIIREFVDKIYVHQAVDFEGQRIQQIDIAWNFIGVFDPPESDLELIKGESA